MRTLALDPVTGDLSISSGRPALVEGADAVAQKLRLRLSIWQGEWFADTTIGVPFRRFLGVPGAQVLAEAILRRAIATCPGVARVDRAVVALDRGSRRLSVSADVTALDGEPVSITDFAAGAP